MYINVLLAFMIIASFFGAIVLHECGHAVVANWLGDPTPTIEGRRTLSIPAHIDPVGTLMCVLLAFQPIMGFGLGWGKPVNLDARKMRVNPDVGLVLVSLAGPLVNLIVGLLVSVLIHFTFPYLKDNIFTAYLLELLVVFAVVNIGLTIFNLIPLHPLDGYQIVYALLPARQASSWSRSAYYGPFLILALFFFLPFIGRLMGAGDFFLFRLASYITVGAMMLVGLASGLPPAAVQALYTL